MRAILLAIALAACSQPAQAPEPAADAPAPAAEAHAMPIEGDQAANLAQMPAWDQARAHNIDFRAVGQEPGWMLDMYGEGDGRLMLLWDYGEHLVGFPRGIVTFPQDGVQRYEEMRSEGHTLVVTVQRTPCADAMSGEAYPSTVEVVIDGRTLNGCGRST